MDLKQLYYSSMLCKILTKDIANGTISHTYMLILPDKMLAEAYAKFFAMQLPEKCLHQRKHSCTNVEAIQRMSFLWM